MGLLSALMRLGRRAPSRGLLRRVEEEATRLPVNPTRELGYASDGSILPVRAGEPFKNSLRGGNADLLAAARMIRPEDWPQFIAMLSAGGLGAGMLGQSERQ